MRTVDCDGGAFQILLDLSAAFDTIDHHKLLNLLEVCFGINGTVLLWVESYLMSRSQHVKIGTAVSEVIALLFGVPQGSVLGPILFILYTTLLAKVIEAHSLSLHLYADDTQLYIGFKVNDPVSTADTLTRLENCIKDIRSWMIIYLLKQNDDKTEFICITSNINKCLNISITVGGHIIKPDLLNIDPPKNLGVLFDSALKLDHHVNPGLVQGCCIHYEVAEKNRLEMILWTLRIHFNFVSHQNFA